MPKRFGNCWKLGDELLKKQLIEKEIHQVYTLLLSSKSYCRGVWGSSHDFFTYKKTLQSFEITSRFSSQNKKQRTSCSKHQQFTDAFKFLRIVHSYLHYFTVIWLLELLYVYFVHFIWTKTCLNFINISIKWKTGATVFACLYCKMWSDQFCFANICSNVKKQRIESSPA